MGKIKLLLVLSLIYIVFFAGNYRSTTTSNTAQVVNLGKTNINRFNILNRGSDTISIRFYDFNTVPTYTSTPLLTLQCMPHQEIYSIQPNNPPANTFSRGLYIRTTVGGVIGAADTYTVSPSVSPIIEINY